MTDIVQLAFLDLFRHNLYHVDIVTASREGNKRGKAQLLYWKYILFNQSYI